MTLRDPVTFPTEDHRSQYPSRESAGIDVDGLSLHIEYVRDLVQRNRCAVTAVSGDLPPELRRSGRGRMRLIRNCRRRFEEITGLKPDYLPDRLLDAIFGS